MSLKLYDFQPNRPEHFPKEGNLIGEFQEQALHLPNLYRFRHPLEVLGQGEALDQWITYQIVQDANRGDGVLIFDPQGKYAHNAIGSLDKTHIKDVVWVDLDAADRDFCLNPFDPYQSGADAEFYEWREYLLAVLSPLSPKTILCVDYALRTLFFSANKYDHSSRTPSFATFMLFLEQDDCRRYIESCMAASIFGRKPLDADFDLALIEVSAQLKPMFMSNKWRGTLGTTDAGKAQNQLTLRGKIVVITGGFDDMPPIVQSIWQYAFFQAMTHKLRAEKGSAFHMYGFHPRAFDTPALERSMWRGEAQQLNLTSVPNAYDQTAAKTRFYAPQTIDFCPDMVGIIGHPYAKSCKENQFLFRQPFQQSAARDFVVDVPPFSTKTLDYGSVAKKYATVKYSRKNCFTLADFDSYIAKDRRAEFYGKMGLPAPVYESWEDMAKAREETEIQSYAAQKGKLIPNPFVGPTGNS